MAYNKKKKKKKLLYYSIIISGEKKDAERETVKITFLQKAEINFVFFSLS